MSKNIDEIDDKDRLILDTLRENSSLSMQKIARKTGIPVATVHHRITKLKASGIIKKYTIIIDQARLGRKMVVHILIKATPKSDHTVLAEKLMKHEWVEDCSVITGVYDVIIKVRLPDIEALDQFVLKFLRTFDEVAESQSMIAYRNMMKD
jgi:Lrp/AsnC family leucine-responsive transcriptional regulator